MEGTRMKVKHARQLAKAHGMKAVVIIGVGADGQVDVATYGDTPASCKVIGDWGQGLLTHSINAVPFQTYFGWGNKGVPLALSRDQLASLDNAARSYAVRYTHPRAEQPKAVQPVSTEAA